MFPSQHFSSSALSNSSSTPIRSLLHNHLLGFEFWKEDDIILRTQLMSAFQMKFGNEVADFSILLKLCSSEALTLVVPGVGVGDLCVVLVDFCSKVLQTLHVIRVAKFSDGLIVRRITSLECSDTWVQTDDPWFGRISQRDAGRSITKSEKLSENQSST